MLAHNLGKPIPYAMVNWWLLKKPIKCNSSLETSTHKHIHRYNGKLDHSWVDLESLGSRGYHFSTVTSFNSVFGPMEKKLFACFTPRLRRFIDKSNRISFKILIGKSQRRPHYFFISQKSFLVAASTCARTCKIINHNALYFWILMRRMTECWTRTGFIVAGNTSKQQWHK